MMYCSNRNTAKLFQRGRCQFQPDGQIRLQIPLISAPMDTVTEANMAIALAKEGGLGIIHKNLSTVRQTEQVMKVKDRNGIIIDPVTLCPQEKVGRAASSWMK